MNYNGFLLQSKINLEITYDAPAGSGKGEGDGDEDEAGGEGDLEGEEEGGGCAYSVFFLSKKMSQLFNCQSNAFKHVTQIPSFKRVIHVIKVWSSLNVLVEQYNFSQMWQVLK